MSDHDDLIKRIEGMNKSWTDSESRKLGTPKEQLLAEINAIVEEFGGIGSIPHGHRYWTLVNQYRSM